MNGAGRDPWSRLGRRTPARIALGRAGVSLPTREVLAFGLAHARARDAVRTPFDRAMLATKLGDIGHHSILIQSLASDRSAYLARPDWGRKLDDASRKRLADVSRSGPFDVAIMIGDGLSALAVLRHAPALLRAVLPSLTRLGVSVSPVVLAEGARVALGDEVGACLGAKLVIVLIGERPGLSSPDSLGVYVTYDPRPGRSDAERNCISNVRPQGLPPERAAHNLAWLVEAALARGHTGVLLKDESESALSDTGEGGPLLAGES